MGGEIVLTEEPEVGAGAATVAAAYVPTVRSNIDTYADEARPAVNFGGSAKLKLNGGAGSDDTQAFLFFARPFPLDATVLEATLKVYLAGGWSGSQDITAKRITERWKEGRLTWDDRPAVSGTNAATETVSGGSDGDEVEIDLTDMLGDVAGGAPWYGVRLELDDDTDRKLWSSENPDHDLRPVLELNWIMPPLAPTNLAPSGERSVSKSKPLLTWRFRDSENEGQASSQVQIDTDETFSSPEYDSGKVTNTVASWDLADTAYGGISDGATRFWRVRVWDEGDLVSDWSDIEEFQRNTQGSLVIDNPAAAPNDFVEETTPPLSWTFSGRTQETAEVRLYQLDAQDAPKRLLEVWRLAEETSVTVPRNVTATSPPRGLVSGVTYRVVVRVWDDFDRQAMAGDPGYVQADRDFTYERSGTPAAVTALTISTTEGSPAVTLTWQRATQPDYFSLSVDGEEMLQRIDPDDVFVSGTTYSMQWWGAEGGAEHTYEMEAVVLDSAVLKHSDGNATADAETSFIGKWLVDPADDTFVYFAGIDEIDWPIGEAGETHILIGSRTPVRITDSVRGYEGSFSGMLIDYAGVTAAEYRDRLLELKGRFVELRLIVADLNLPVFLEEISVPPRPDTQGANYNTTVAFFQTDDFFDLVGG